MVRPPKDPKLCLDDPLVVMLTAEQKRLIKEASEAAGMDMSAWIRPILVKAAKQEILVAERGKGGPKGR